MILKKWKLVQNFCGNFYQTLTVFFWRLNLKNLNNDYQCQKIEKNFQKLSKNAKICDAKILQDIPLHLEIIR